MRVKVFRKARIKHVWAYLVNGQELAEVVEVKVVRLNNVTWYCHNDLPLPFHAKYPDLNGWAEGELLENEGQVLTDPVRVRYKKTEFRTEEEPINSSPVALLDERGHAWAGTGWR